MGLYELAARTSSGTSAAAAWEIRTSANVRARIMELGVFLAAATASTYGLGRPAAIGVTPTSPVDFFRKIPPIRPCRAKCSPRSPGRPARRFQLTSFAGSACLRRSAPELFGPGREGSSSPRAAASCFESRDQRRRRRLRRDRGIVRASEYYGAAGVRRITDPRCDAGQTGPHGERTSRAEFHQHDRARRGFIQRIERDGNGARTFRLGYAHSHRFAGAGNRRIEGRVRRRFVQRIKQNGDGS